MMTRNQKIWLGLGAAGVIAVFLLAPSTTASPSYVLRYKEDDLDLLLPSFKAKIVTLLSRLKARGFDPVVVDTRRTAAQAAANAAKGTGIVDSLHITGAAADIISNAFGRSSAAFNRALAEESLRLGLTSGSTFSNNDVAHVQAVSVAKQNAYRALTSEAARDAFVTNYYRTMV